MIIQVLHCPNCQGTDVVRSLEDHSMGKPLPPFSQLIASERRRSAPFKRVLPKADQAIDDRLFACAKLPIQAGVRVLRRWPFEIIVLAVLLEQQKRVGEMVKKLEELGAGQSVI